MRLAVTAAILALAVQPALADTSSARATAQLKGHGGETGKASFQEAPAGVLVVIELNGFTPGWHGVHLHAKGDCSDAKFDAAGGHINHAAAKAAHGLLAGPDFGDLPNVFVGADGRGTAEVYSTLVSLGGAGGRPAVLDADGTALVVHANRDDHATQPIGGAGARVACGVIR